MKALLLLLIFLPLAACTNLPVAMPGGQVAHATMVGGKGVLSYDAHGRPIYTYNNEKSLQHAIQGGVALGTAGLSYLTTKAQELTTQLQNANLTQIQRDTISADLSKTLAQIASSDKQAAIAAGLPPKG